MSKKDIAYFDELWASSFPKDGMKHTKETWDRLAEDWRSSPSEVQAQKDVMCGEIARYALARGIINKDSLVADIGCGSGNYAVEFAKLAGHVTCSDISTRMLELCRELVAEQGLHNVDYVDCDFLAFDIEKAGWLKKYDLVFTSLTPAMSGLASVEKVNRISRGWCFNNSFIYRKDFLRNEVMEKAFGLPPRDKFDGSSTYCLFNILWQLGYMPEIRYYKEQTLHDYELDMGLCKRIASMIIRDRAPSEEEVQTTYKYLEENFAVDGKVKKATESLFAWTYWYVGE